MLEAKFNNQTEVGERVITEDVSVLLLKPEVALLDLQEKNQLAAFLEADFSLNGVPLCIFPVSIDKETARNLWLKDIAKYEWAETYYEYMASAPCIALVLKGRESAFCMKKKIRTEMAGSILRVKTVLGSGFSPDIAHGSDPGDGYSEFQIFTTMFLCKEG
jgi:hypothetical protein